MRLRNFPKVTQLLSGWTLIWVWVICLLFYQTGSFLLFHTEKTTFFLSLAEVWLHSWLRNSHENITGFTNGCTAFPVQPPSFNWTWRQLKMKGIPLRLLLIGLYLQGSVMRSGRASRVLTFHDVAEGSLVQERLLYNWQEHCKCTVPWWKFQYMSNPIIPCANNSKSLG